MSDHLKCAGYWVNSFSVADRHRAITWCTIKGSVYSAEIEELGFAEVVILELKLDR